MGLAAGRHNEFQRPPGGTAARRPLARTNGRLDAAEVALEVHGPLVEVACRDPRQRAGHAEELPVSGSSRPLSRHSWLASRLSSTPPRLDPLMDLRDLAS